MLTDAEREIAAGAAERWPKGTNGQAIAVMESGELALTIDEVRWGRVAYG